MAQLQKQFNNAKEKLTLWQGHAAPSRRHENRWQRWAFEEWTRRVDRYVRENGLGHEELTRRAMD